MKKIDIYNNLVCLNKGSHHGSWAIWRGITRKEAGDTSILDELPENKALFNQLNPAVVLVALNPSGTEDRRATKDDKEHPWKNFHNSKSGDGLLAEALQGTPFYGAYITDFIKISLGAKSTSAVKSYLGMPKSKRTSNVNKLVKELEAIGLDNIEAIVALGNDAFELLKKELPDNYKQKKIGKITHYGRGRYMKKGEYAKLVKNQIDRIEGVSKE